MCCNYITCTYCNNDCVYLWCVCVCVCGKQVFSPFFVSCRKMLGGLVTWIRCLAIVCQAPKNDVLNGQTQMEALALFNGCLGYVPGDQWIAVHMLRALVNLVSVSVKWRDINTEVGGAFCDCGYWMMNDKEEHKVVLRSLSCEQWTSL